MACDCKANRAIFELGKRYGTTARPTRKDLLVFGVWKYVQYLFLALFAVLASPILFLIIAYKANIKKEKVIHLDRMVGLSRK